MSSTDEWNGVMQAEDLAGLPVAETRELPRAWRTMTEERLVALILAEIRMLREARSPWVDMRGLAAYSGWGFNTIKRLSSQNLIPGKVRHDGKVRFHLPTFDDWLLTEHRAGPLVALPHEEAGRASVSRGAAAASNGLAPFGQEGSSDAR